MRLKMLPCSSANGIAGALVSEVRPGAIRVPQLADRLWWHETGPQQVVGGELG